MNLDPGWCIFLTTFLILFLADLCYGWSKPDFRRKRSFETESDGPRKGEEKSSSPCGTYTVTYFYTSADRGLVRGSTQRGIKNSLTLSLEVKPGGISGHLSPLRTQSPRLKSPGIVLHCACGARHCLQTELEGLPANGTDSSSGSMPISSGMQSGQKSEQKYFST